MGEWECDDGNTVSGDGCSSTCMIETQYYCYGGSTTTKDVCKLEPQPVISSIIVNSANNMVTITFNETMLL